ncbi:2-oxoacid:acceptor oxidoreductase family protein [candidate division KSB1 bacterium]
MIEVRFHGRGGQGVVMAAKMLAAAMLRDGLFGQAIPAFGTERRGAPVLASVRMDRRPIRLRCQVYHPDHLVVFDPSLLAKPQTLSGLKDDGTILVNSPVTPADKTIPDNIQSYVVDISRIAWEEGLIAGGIPMINTAVLGAFSRATGIVSLESVEKTVTEYFPAKADTNLRAIRTAYQRLGE